MNTSAAALAFEESVALVARSAFQEWATEGRIGLKKLISQSTERETKRRTAPSSASSLVVLT